MPARDLLRRLAARPLLLWALALLGNALWMPYVGIRHDAPLYAAQAVHAADGRFADDLFFAYGSQSQYSLTPQILAAATSCFGVEWAFFLGHLASAAALIAGLTLFLRRLLGPTEVLPLAVLWCACTPLPCGYGTILHVNESFLTTRPLAAALGLFALERLLAGRWLGFAALTAAAVAIHPLIATPVGLIGTAYAVARLGRRGWALVAAATVLGLAVLAVPGLPATLFGAMGETWRGQVVAVMAYTRPLNWDATDFQRLALAAAAVVAFARLNPRTPAATLAASALLVAAVGVILASYAAGFEARLLFQGQPYRWVWVLEVLAGPLTLAVAAQVWPAGDTRIRWACLFAVVAAAGFPLLDRPTLVLGLAAAAVIAFVAWRFAGFAAWPTAFAAAAAALLVADAMRLSHIARAAVVMPFAQSPEFEAWVLIAGATVGPLLRVASVLALGLALRRVGPDGRLAAGLAVAALVAQLAFWQVSRSDWAERRFQTDAPDMHFVEAYLRQPAPGPSAGRRTCVYFPAARPKWLWFDLNCDAYFTLAQCSGITFSAAGSAECIRRGHLVLPFELALADDRGRWAPFFAGVEPHTTPTQADFDALAAESTADVLVLRQEFPGYVATNGRVYVYDLRGSRGR